MFRNVCHRAFRGSRGAKGARKKNVRWSQLHGRGGARRFYTAAKCMRIIDSDAIAIHHGCNLITTRYASPVHGTILQYTYIMRWSTGRFIERGHLRFMRRLYPFTIIWFFENDYYIVKCRSYTYFGYINCYVFLNELLIKILFCSTTK